jgi:hypothetical protein
MMVRLTVGEKKANSKMLRNPGPENRILIHWKRIYSCAIPREDPRNPWSKPSSKNGVLM